MIPAPSVLLLGEPGSGKTTSLRTLSMANLETFVIFLEPAMEIVADVPCPYMHYQFIRPITETLDQMIAQARTLASTPWDILTGKSQTSVPINGADRDSLAAPWLHLLSALKNPTCDRCGKEMGDVTTWGFDRALAIDGLSGINKAAERYLLGGQINTTNKQIGLVMQSELTLFGEYLPVNTWCTYVLLGHLRIAYTKATGETKKFPHVVGQANVADWARMFNDVVRAVKTGVEFTWSTASIDADVKGRNLPISDGLPQDFRPLLTNWWQRAQHTTVDLSAQQQPGAPSAPTNVQPPNSAATIPPI